MQSNPVESNPALAGGANGQMPLLSTRAVAKILGVEVRFVRGALRRGELKGLRLGKRKWRVRQQDLSEYIRQAVEREDHQQIARRQ